MAKGLVRNRAVETVVLRRGRTDLPTQREAYNNCRLSPPLEEHPPSTTEDTGSKHVNADRRIDGEKVLLVPQVLQSHHH